MKRGKKFVYSLQVSAACNQLYNDDEVHQMKGYSSWAHCTEPMHRTLHLPQLSTLCTRVHLHFDLNWNSAYVNIKLYMVQLYSSMMDLREYRDIHN